MLGGMAKNSLQAFSMYIVSTPHEPVFLKRSVPVSVNATAMVFNALVSKTRAKILIAFLAFLEAYIESLSCNSRSYNY